MPVPAGMRRWGEALVPGRLAVALFVALAAMLASSASAHAGTGSDCPPIQNKPGAIPQVGYDSVAHITYCEGPITVSPGQNVIRLNATSLIPSQPGYITRFDPELVYTNGTVPRVDVLHLHHAVWVVNGNPQFAVGEEKTIVQAPRGFGWRTEPTDRWFLNDMLHDLVGREARVYIVWRIDFVPDTAPAAAHMRTVRTRWMDVSGPSPRVGISSPIYPVFNALRGDGHGGRYPFPDEATGFDRGLA